MSENNEGEDVDAGGREEDDELGLGGVEVVEGVGIEEDELKATERSLEGATPVFLFFCFPKASSCSPCFSMASNSLSITSVDVTPQRRRSCLSMSERAFSESKPLEIRTGARSLRPLRFNQSRTCRIRSFRAKVSGSLEAPADESCA